MPRAPVVPASAGPLPVGRLQRAAGPVQLALGTGGVVAAGVLLAPKLAAIAAGTAVAGVGLVANVALLGGSLMFLRQGWRAWRRVRAATSDAPRPDRAAD